MAGLNSCYNFKLFIYSRCWYAQLHAKVPYDISEKIPPILLYGTTQAYKLAHIPGQFNFLNF